MRDIDYGLLVERVDQMINTLEWDSMRSAGKAKQAAMDLNQLYMLKDRYDAMIKPAAKKPAAKKVTEE